MNILILHNSYLIKGGEDESTKNEINILRQNGHNVITYIVDNKDLTGLKSISLALSTIWSVKSYRIVKKLIKENKIEIMHVQNFHPVLSPSVYYAAKSLGVPVIQSIRNYRIICPSALLFRENDLCYKCVGKSIPYHGLVYRCYRKSFAASAVVVVMLAIHNYLNTWNRKVDIYLSVSEFVKQVMVEGGIENEKILVKPNFLLTESVIKEEHEHYFVFVGRLTLEKGIKTLCNAWKILGTDIPLKVIGEGVEEVEVFKLKSEGYQVELLGKLPNKATLDIISKAKAVIVPSLWNEPFGRVVIEAYAFGIPVIASNIGGMSELVENNKTGLLFEASNSVDLANKITQLINCSNFLEIKRNAYKKYVESFSAEKNYSFLIETYENVLRNLSS